MGDVEQGLVYLRVHVLEDVGLAFNVGAVDTEDRIEGPELVPAGKQLTVGLVAFAAGEVVYEEPADVMGPPGIPGQGHIESADHLVLEDVPTGG